MCFSIQARLCPWGEFLFKLTDFNIYFFFLSYEGHIKTPYLVLLFFWCFINIRLYKCSFIDVFLYQTQIHHTGSDFIKNIFICALKMNEGLTGLERHKGE